MHKVCLQDLRSGVGVGQMSETVVSVVWGDGSTETGQVLVPGHLRDPQRAQMIGCPLGVEQ
jgi:hypothetical protein